eukprot:1161840-Pelagomonas_calceolata.AAC.9
MEQARLDTRLSYLRPQHSPKRRCLCKEKQRLHVMQACTPSITRMLETKHSQLPAGCLLRPRAEADGHTMNTCTIRALPTVDYVHKQRQCWQQADAYPCVARSGDTPEGDGA